MQFCPGNPDFFVIGTYNLERSDSDVDSQSTEPEEAVKKPQNRNGSLVVFRLDGDDVFVNLHFSPEFVAKREIANASKQSSSLQRC